jgi:hypothetical protein
VGSRHGQLPDKILSNRESTMLNPKESNQIAAANEVSVAKQFEKLGYVVERLDHPKKTARPDFLISNSAGCPQLLCEVKTILSAGYLRERHAHVSMLDDNLANSGVFETKIDLTDINEGLASAVRKRAALVADDSSVADLPLLVAFFFDFFADFLHCLPRQMDEHISGILTIKDDVARSAAFEKLSRQEQERRLRSGDESGLPPRSKDCVLVRNKDARRVVPQAFQLQCITEGYDESL